MSVNNEVALRPRFKIILEQDNESALTLFQHAKTSQTEFIVSRVDDHVFIKYPQEKRHFWSPQLHLEINEIDTNSSQLYGLFGPSPTVWTLFMFLHFMVAGLFIAFGIWAYTNWSLEKGFAIQLAITLFMVIVWFVLYFMGRVGRSSGKGEMHALHVFMNSILRR